MASKMVYNALASFSCPRTVTFLDWRLGFTHKALMAGAAAAPTQATHNVTR